MQNKKQTLAEQMAIALHTEGSHNHKSNTGKAPHDPFAGWKHLLALWTEDQIRDNTANGITAMSKDNLWQIVKIPQSGGPIGTNARYMARQMFDEVIAGLKPRYRKHIIG